MILEREATLSQQKIGVAKLCIFQVPGLENYSLALTFPEVLAVSSIAEFQSVPFAPDFALGLGLWNDQLVSIIDLGAALTGKPAKALDRHESSRYLIGQTIWGGRREVFACPILQGTETYTVLLDTVEIVQESTLDTRLIYSVIHTEGREFVLINAMAFGQPSAERPKASKPRA